MAKLDIPVHIDLFKQQLLNAKLQFLSGHPAVTEDDLGFIYYNSVDDTAYMYGGKGWIDLGQVYAHPDFPGNSQPTTALTGASVISSVTLDNGHVTAVKTRNLTPDDIGAALKDHKHIFSDIIDLPANTILANNTGTKGTAKAITVADFLTMLGISEGSLPLLVTGTDIKQRTWKAKDIADYVKDSLVGYLKVINLGVTTTTTTVVVTNDTTGTNATIPAATTSKAGVMSVADKTKLNNIAEGANKYEHPTLNPGTHPFATTLTSGLQVLSQLVVNELGHTVAIKGRNLTAADIATVMINNAISNGTTSTWSSQKIRTEIDDAVTSASTGALQYKGEYNPGSNTPPITTDTTVKVGYTYVVSVDGMFLGEAMETGDMIIAKVDNPGNSPKNWQTVNKNIPAIVEATETVKGIIQLATVAEAKAGAIGNKVITPHTLKAVLDERTGGYVANFGNGSGNTFTITHNLSTQDVHVTVQVVATRAPVLLEWKAASANTVVVNTNVAPANNAYRILISRL